MEASILGAQEEVVLALTEKDCELPEDLVEEPSPEFSEGELADLFASGTLTEEAWQVIPGKFRCDRYRSVPARKARVFLVGAGR